MRGFPLPDASHQQWGDYGRAVASCGLKGATLKLTHICACGSGPYTSGRNHFTNKQAATLLLEGKDESWFDQHLTAYAFDQRVSARDVALNQEVWLESPGVSGRFEKGPGFSNNQTQKLARIPRLIHQNTTWCCCGVLNIIMRKVVWQIMLTCTVMWNVLVTLGGVLIGGLVGWGVDWWVGWLVGVAGWLVGYVVWFVWLVGSCFFRICLLHFLCFVWFTGWLIFWMLSYVVHLIHCSMSHGEFVSNINLAHSPWRPKTKAGLESWSHTTCLMGHGQFSLKPPALPNKSWGICHMMMRLVRTKRLALRLVSKGSKGFASHSSSHAELLLLPEFLLQ